MRAEYVAGFTVAEGCFTSTGTPPRFAFTVALGARDLDTCEGLAAFFDVGRVYRYARRAPTHDDVVIYTVQKRGELVEGVVPFMDRYLPASQKRKQYESWRDALLERLPHSPEAVRMGSSGTIVSQSTREASDQRRSRS